MSESLRLFFIVLLMTLTGCGLFKNTTKSSNEIYADTKVLRFYSDSSSYEEEVLIWPKGKFSYSPGTGFFGEAEKVQLKEKGRMVIESSEIKSQHYSAEEKLVLQKSKMNWLLWVLIGAGGIYLSFKFYKI